jgi:hypothetical protein
MSKLRNLAMAMFAAGSLAGKVQAAVSATPLTADVTNNIVATQTACGQLQYDQLLLDISRAAGDSVGVTANLTLVKADRTAAQSAGQALRAAIDAYMKPALDAVSVADTSFQAAFVQLKSDGAANPGALPTDKSAILSQYAGLRSAETQAQANQQALAGAGATLSCGFDLGDDSGTQGGLPQHH